MAFDNRRSSAAKKIDRLFGIPLVFVAAAVRSVFRGRRPSAANAPILVIKLSALGDAVVMLPALHRLKNEFKDSPIVFLGGGSNAGFVNELVETGFVSKFIKFDLGAVRALRKEKFKAVVDFDQWVRTTALVSATLHSGIKAGFRSRDQHRHAAYDVIQDFSPAIHSGENFWNLASTVVKAVNGKITEPATFESDREAVKSWWVSRIMRSTSSAARPVWPQSMGDSERAALVSGSYMIVHPGCGEHGRYREWPLDSWSELIQALKVNNPGLAVFVTGAGSHEQTMAENLKSAGAVSLVNLLSFKQLMTVLRDAKTIYSGNTGIMHLGSLLNKNVVVINGPTNPVLWGPLWNGHVVASPLACAPCLTWGNDYGCDDPVCVKVITVSQVLGATDAQAASTIF